jgi:hypothetical protein
LYTSVPPIGIELKAPEFPSYMIFFQNFQGRENEREYSRIFTEKRNGTNSFTPYISPSFPPEFPSGGVPKILNRAETS